MTHVWKTRGYHRATYKNRQQRDLERRIDLFFYEVGPAAFWVQERDFKRARLCMKHAYVLLDALDSKGTEPYADQRNRTQPAVGTAELDISLTQRIERVISELELAQYWVLRSDFVQVRTHMLEATIELDAINGKEKRE